MVRRIAWPASLAAALNVTGPAAFADEPIYKDAERERVEFLDRESGVSGRAPVHLHYRYRYRPARAAYPRRHFFVDGVHTNGFYGPVNYATVTYRTYVYYTPTDPRVTFAYPPYAFVYGLTPGPVYNKPCLC